MSEILLSRGSRLVDRTELDAIPIPAHTDTWFPVSHAAVLEKTLQTLSGAGFEPRRTSLALSQDDNRFFGTIDLEAGVATGVSLVVGIRNSLDKSLPIAFCAGSRVFVCDNLAFRSEVQVSRKHTRFGEIRFGEAIAQAVSGLGQFRTSEAHRIKWFQNKDLGRDAADSLILRSYEAGIVSHLQLPRVIQEWRMPKFEEFHPRTYWSLENAFTTALGPLAQKSPQRYCGLTIALQGLLAQAAGFEEVAFGSVA